MLEELETAVSVSCYLILILNFPAFWFPFLKQRLYRNYARLFTILHREIYYTKTEYSKTILSINGYLSN